MEIENENMDMSILLLRYINGEATNNDIVEIEQWLKADASHLLYLKQLRKENEFAKSTINAVDFNANSAYSKFSKTIIKQKQKRISKRIYLSVASIAAIFILFFGIPYFKHNTTTIVKSEKITEHIALLDSVSQIVLPDNSKIILNSGSKLSYTDTYNQKLRKVTISGEAFLSVTHDSLKPFIVDIEGVQVQVKGTSFNVAHDSINQQVIVSVKTGKVLVTSKTEKVLITKSQKAIIHLQTQKIVTSTSNNENNYAWVTGELEFNNTPLVEVIESLNKNFKTNIEIASPDIKHKTVYATFYKNDNIQTILQTIQVGMSIEIIQKNGKYVLYETTKN